MKARRPGLPVVVGVVLATHALLFLATAMALGSIRAIDVGAVAWSHAFYFENASKALAGQVPYRDFVFEYPILAFPLFWIPRLLTSDLATYRILFIAEMWLFDAWTIILIAAQVARTEGADRVAGRLGWYTLACLPLAPLLIGRFELAPMALGFAAAHWWFSGRERLGGFVAGLGALMKVFPGLVALPALVADASQFRTRSPRGSLAFLATCAAGAAIWLMLGGARVRESIEYQTGRGLEIESIYAGIAFLGGAIAGIEVPWTFDHKAYHIAGAWGRGLAPWALPIQALVLLLVAWRFWRSGMGDGVRYAGAAVLAFIIAGKVLSPQFLIWLLPFPMVLGGATGNLARKIFLLACFGTALIYPGPGFPMLLAHRVEGALLLNVRNALLVWLLALLVTGARVETPSQGGSVNQP